MADHDSPALPFGTIRERHNAAIFFWAQNNVFAFGGEIFQKPPRRFITTVFASLNAPNNSFYNGWRSPKELLHSTRLFYRKADLVGRKSFFHFCIGHIRKRKDGSR